MPDQKPMLDYATPVRRQSGRTWRDILIVLSYAIGIAVVVLSFFAWLIYAAYPSIS